MKAINLIPSEERRSGRGATGGSSGIGAYIVLGVLALAVVMIGAKTYVERDLDAKNGEIAALQSQAANAKAQATKYAPYVRFSQLATARQQTVVQLAESRFKWGSTMSELARVLPKDTYLKSVNGTIAPGMAGGGGNALRSAVAAPALELEGCTANQDSVSNFLARLRLMNHVDRVSLESSDRSDSGDGGDGGDAASNNDGGYIDPCVGKPIFKAVVFYDQAVTPPAAGDAQAGGAPAPADGANNTETTTTTTETQSGNDSDNGDSK